MKLRVAIAIALCLGAAGILVPDLYYRSSAGRGCSRCHEIGEQYRLWTLSSHRTVPCETCHRSSLFTNVRRVATHLRGRVPEEPSLATRDVFDMVERCRDCHRNEYAEWQAGPHRATYAEIFLDRKHNTETRLREDCFRCHGMHFDGNLPSLVTPMDRKGPWRLVDAKMAGRPAIPCLACHAVHREGAPLRRPAEGRQAVSARQETFRPSLALFDRREQRPVALSTLPMPVVKEGARPVRMSPDSRQALCYQCHAPEPSAQAGSGDDRTPLGVHEGLSCLACHSRHRQTTRASCATCHPRLSNCGLDVEKMDTTFLNPASRHNIHTVKCLDCHPKGTPARRATPKPVVSD